MLGIKIIAVGKLKESYLREGCAEYLKRMGPLASVEVAEIPEYKIPANPSAAEIAAGLKKESELILGALPARALVAALCIEGESVSSEGLADILKRAETGGGKICFIIGGSHGLDDDVKRRADIKFSFSRMTFPHMLVRLMLLEQTYRALSINSGGKYHK